MMMPSSLMAGTFHLHSSDNFDAYLSEVGDEGDDAGDDDGSEGGDGGDDHHDAIKLDGRNIPPP